MEMEKNYLSGSFFHGVFNPEVNEKIEKLYSLNKALRTFAEVREEDRSSAYVPVYCSGYRYHVQKNGLDMCFLTCEDMSGETISIPVFASYWEFVKIKFFGEGYYLIKVFGLSIFLAQLNKAFFDLSSSIITSLIGTTTITFSKS